MKEQRLQPRNSRKRLEAESEAQPERAPVIADLSLLGARIREIRNDRKLNLVDVATRTGLSVSMISALERGATNPSVGTLIAVAEALGVSLVEFFGVDRGPGPSPVMRFAEQPQFESDSGVRRRLIFRDPARGLEMAQNEYPPGARSADKALRHGGFEFGVVLAGSLVVELNGQVWQLAKGDSIAYPSTTPHRISNPGTKTAQTIWVNLYHES